MRAPITALLMLTAAGCWKDDFAAIPPDVLQFQPPVEAPLGWLVAPFEGNLACPDGGKSRFYLLYSEEMAESGTPTPAAVMYHSGSFDFVFAPDPGDPLSGTHYANPSRLTAEWAIRQVFVTLGMYPAQDEVELHDGLLATALAERGVAVLLPVDCWGDLWGNKRGGADNDFPADFFFREGLASAEWGYRFLVDPLFASAFDIELPIVVDTAQVYGIGLGEGGRAVAELLSIDNDEDGVGDYQLAGAMVDSPPDDLRPYFDDPGLYASTVTGLLRLFPAGADSTARGSMWNAVLPARTAYLYSPQDPTQTEIVAAAAIARIEAEGGWVYTSSESKHVLSNGGGSMELARDAVTYLLDGTHP